MINLKVKTLWQGKIAIRDKYVEKAKETNQDISVEFLGKKMTIPVNEINNLIVGRSAPQTDYFSNASHKLIYFKWKLL